jgi:hypothetical protein
MKGLFREGLQNTPISDLHLPLLQGRTGDRGRLRRDVRRQMTAHLGLMLVVVGTVLVMLVLPVAVVVDVVVEVVAIVSVLVKDVRVVDVAVVLVIVVPTATAPSTQTLRPFPGWRSR